MTSPTVEAGDDLPLTIPVLLHDRAQAAPDRKLLVCDDDVLTYGAALERSTALARGLVAAGASKGTHVGILHPNGSDFVVSWLAAARIGAVSVPFSTFSTGPELRGLLRGADITLLLSANAYRSHDYVRTLAGQIADLDLSRPPPVLAAAVPTLRRIAFARPLAGADRAWSVAALVEGGRSIDDAVLDAAEAAVHPSDRMVIVHTSGSTSEPKGVIHTHGALIRHLHNLNELRRFEPPEILFAASPFFWIGGFAYALLGTLVAGATLVCSGSPDAARVLDVLERERPTMVNGFAQAVAHLPDDPTFSQRDLSSIRRGNLHPIMPASVRPTDPELRHAMLGMTECGSLCLVSDDESDQPEHRRGSFGKPAPGMAAKVIDPERGTDVAAGHIGELCLRGPFLMEGYYGRERKDTFDAEEWFHTGDLVHVDDDGFFYFHGRAGDMIKTAGANVSPREVEAAIHEEAGLVSHVFGVDDEARGQLVTAVVRVPPERSVDPEELRAALGKRLSAYKVPRRLLLVAEADLPLLSSGKVDLRALQERARGE